MTKYRTIKITEVEVKQKRDNFDKLGVYLKIEIDSKFSTYIFKEDIENKIREVSERKKPQFSITSAINQEEIPQLVEEVDYKDILLFILKDVDKKRFDNIDVLYVLGSDYFILGLPWEELYTTNQIIVIRKLLNFNHRSNEINLAYVNSLLMITSYAYKPYQKNLEEDIKEEIENIIKIANENHKLNINSILWLHHFSPSYHSKFLKSVNYFNLLHIAMHGDKPGYLLVSKDIYENKLFAKRIKIEEILEIFKSHQFQFVLISSCYSAGSLEDPFSTNLCFEFVNKGFTRYCIGYLGGVNSEKAKKFSENFYKYLDLYQIEKTYIKTLRLFSKFGIPYKFLPVLYTIEE